MLLFPVTATETLPFTDIAARDTAVVLAAYEEAFRRCAASTERVGDDELAFRVSLRPPERMGLSQPDLGLVSEGMLTVAGTGEGYRVSIRAQPRNWFVAASIAPWLLLIWGLGFTAAPWRYLMAFGGLPLLIAMWLLIWSNLSAFLDHTHTAIRSTAKTGGATGAATGSSAP